MDPRRPPRSTYFIRLHGPGRSEAALAAAKAARAAQRAAARRAKATQRWKAAKAAAAVQAAQDAAAAAAAAAEGEKNGENGEEARWVVGRVELEGWSSGVAKIPSWGGGFSVSFSRFLFAKTFLPQAPAGANPEELPPQPPVVKPPPVPSPEPAKPAPEPDDEEEEEEDDEDLLWHLGPYYHEFASQPVPTPQRKYPPSEIRV